MVRGTRTWYVVRGTDHVVRRGMHIIHHTWYVVCHVTDVTYVYIIQEYRFIIIIQTELQTRPGMHTTP